MSFYQLLKDGFWGKPDFSKSLPIHFSIDDMVVSFECPSNVKEYEIFYNSFSLSNFPKVLSIEEHEKLVQIAYFYFSFGNIFPKFIISNLTNESVFIRLKIKNFDNNVENIEILSEELEKNYINYYHDPSPSETSLRGKHTSIMSEAIDYANSRWGNNPKDIDFKKKRDDYLLVRLLRGFPPIKCELVNIGQHTYSKYSEGDLERKLRYMRSYNTPIRDGYFLSIEFIYVSEGSLSKRKLLDWINQSDNGFEKDFLEKLEISDFIESCSEDKLKIVFENSEIIKN